MAAATGACVRLGGQGRKPRLPQRKKSPGKRSHLRAKANAQTSNATGSDDSPAEQGQAEGIADDGDSQEGSSEAYPSPSSERTETPGVARKGPEGGSQRLRASVKPKPEPAGQWWKSGGTAAIAGGGAALIGAGMLLARRFTSSSGSVPDVGQSIRNMQFQREFRLVFFFSFPPPSFGMRRRE